MSYPASKMSPDFNAFFAEQKRKITAHLKSIGCTEIKFDRGYYYFSAFFTNATGQVYYLCSTDFRGDKERFYYRTAKDYQDYTGGSNNWSSFNNLKNIKL